MGEWSIETKIVRALVRDISDRKGLGDEWESVDPEIQDEIEYEWEAIIRKILREVK